MKNGQNNKKNKIKMHVTSISSKFHGHVFMLFLVYYSLKENEGTKKKVNKKKSKVMTRLLEAFVFLFINNAS